MPYPDEDDGGGMGGMAGESMEGGVVMAWLNGPNEAEEARAEFM